MHKRAVDVYSQRESNARIGCKTNRWWPRLAWFLVDMAINNAHTLYKQRGAAPKLSPTQFRERLMEALVGDFTQRKKRGRPEKVHIRADEPKHIPVKLSAPQPCMVCAKKLRLVMGEHKPRVSVGCQQCGRACHIKCWKEHLPVESGKDEWKCASIIARVPRQVALGL